MSAVVAPGPVVAVVLEPGPGVTVELEPDGREEESNNKESMVAPNLTLGAIDYSEDWLLIEASGDETISSSTRSITYSERKEHAFSKQ